MKIGLVVEDIPEIRESFQSNLRDRLTHLGFECIDGAQDGVEALEKMKTKSYSFVLSDLQMPRMDGKALLSAIQNDEKLKLVPVIMMSGLMDSVIERGLLEQGAVFCLQKPLNYDTCVSEIRRALAI